MSGEAQLLHAHFLAWFTAAAWWHVFCVVLHIAMKCVHLDSQEAAWRSCVPQYVETDMRALRGRYAGLFTGFSRLRLRKCEVKKLDFSKEIRDEKKNMTLCSPTLVLAYTDTNEHIRAHINKH